MKACTITLCALLGACASSLRQGDQAFERGDYAAAATAWQRSSDAPADEIRWRLALLRVVPGSTLHDPAGARVLMSELQEQFPKTLWGVTARWLLDALHERDQLTAQLAETEARLARCAEDTARAEAAHADAAKACQASLAKLTDERTRLANELKSLRDVQTEVQTLREENARLSAVIEELKRIDLRR